MGRVGRDGNELRRPLGLEGYLREAVRFALVLVGLVDLVDLLYGDRSHQSHQSHQLPQCQFCEKDIRFLPIDGPLHDRLEFC